MEMRENRIVCITGLTGAGKSEVSDRFVEKGFQYVRFGQLTIDEVKRRGLEISEKNERSVREDLRAKHGMAAFATLNLPKFDELMFLGPVIADGLYSFEEYKVLKEHYGDKMVVVAVWAPPEIRYDRLEQRFTGKGDKQVRNRKLTRKEAKSRDYAEIEKLNKGGTIAMAEYTILNTKDFKYLLNQVDETIEKISGK